MIVRRYPHPFRLVRVFGLTQRGDTLIVEDVLSGERERVVTVVLDFTQEYTEMEALAWAAKG